MENSDSYSEVMGQANLFRNANFGALQEKANIYVDKEKNEKSEIEGVTAPLEIPLIDKFGGRLGKRVMKKLGMETEEEGDGLMKTLAKKGLNSLLEKAGLKKPDAKPTKDDDTKDDDTKDEPTKPTEDAAEDAVKDEDTSFEGVKNRFKKLSDDDKEDVRNNLENNSEFTDKETLESLPDDIREASQLKNTELLNDEVTSKEGQAGEDIAEKTGEDAEDALGEEPELLSGVKSALSDAKSAVSDAADSGISSITSGVKSALSDAKSAVSDAATGVKDAVSTGVKDAVSGGGKSLAEKLAAKAGEAEAEGGGPEDPVGDIISAGLAVGALVASIFGKHIKHPDIQNKETMLVATQGYGLAEE
tara:strand:- start:2348 stop:3430 length:1083 start_codon:yes stop_codon:yes gene_type:complete